MENLIRRYIQNNLKDSLKKKEKFVTYSVPYKQASLEWWKLLDAGVFIFRNKQGYVIVIIYIDDAIFMRPNKKLLMEKKQNS